MAVEPSLFREGRLRCSSNEPSECTHAQDPETIWHTVNEWRRRTYLLRDHPRRPPGVALRTGGGVTRWAGSSGHPNYVAMRNGQAGSGIRKRVRASLHGQQHCEAGGGDARWAAG